MCNSITINLNEFTGSQIELYHLNNHVIHVGDESYVVFRQNGKPGLIPYLQNQEVVLTFWVGFKRENELETIRHLEPELVEIPAHEGCQSGIWFPVYPQRIKGVIVDGKLHSMIYMLLKPSTDYFREMTKSEWEPVYTGEQKYLRKIVHAE